MKIIKKIPWMILFIQVVLVFYVINVFEITDTTLYKGDIYSFDTGWTLLREDGSEAEIELPYYEDCKAGALVKIKNVIPEMYWGKTLSFITADKNVRIYIDEELIYEFGVNDKRDFGHTPGSITNFVDIPSRLTKGEIVIELSSPYKNYSACIDSMTIANRDISILNMINRNIPAFGCIIIMLLVTIVFCILAWGQRWLKQGTEGTEYLAVFSFLSFIYYSIETKALHLLFGNHTVHSVIVFLMLMSMPIFLLTYYVKRFDFKNTKAIHTVLVIAIINECVQIPLQIFDVMDFMNMALVSHAILFAGIIVTICNLFMLPTEKEDVKYILDIVALLIFGISGIGDIIRNYTLKAEHIEKCSRYGVTIYLLIMLITHMIGMIKKYVAALEENAVLLEQKVESAEKKNNAKTVFLTRMSHEIRTPINAILGMNKAIINEAKDEYIRECAEDVEGAAQALLGIVNEILDLSKIEAGKMTLAEGEYATSSMLYDVTNMIAVRAQTKDLQFVVNVDPNLPVKLYGDDIKIRQVLVNLLSNAVKYTNEGTVTMTLECERLADERSVKLTCRVSDTGIGIKEEDMPKLFQEYERFEEERNRTIEGTGLGMSITLQFLKLLDSHLEVESQYGSGSTFTFAITQKIVDETPIGDFDKKFMQRKKKYQQEDPIKVKGNKVLLVDDYTVNRRIFTILLKDTGINVVEAGSGEECLKLVKDEKYDIIFLDHMMPGMDGIQTLEAFRTLEGNQNLSTPVVALTANAIDGAKEYYISKGFDDYLEKPIEKEKLLALIEKYI